MIEEQSEACVGILEVPLGSIHCIVISSSSHRDELVTQSQISIVFSYYAFWGD